MWQSEAESETTNIPHLEGEETRGHRRAMKKTRQGFSVSNAIVCQNNKIKNGHSRRRSLYELRFSLLFLLCYLLFLFCARLSIGLGNQGDIYFQGWSFLFLEVFHAPFFFLSFCYNPLFCFIFLANPFYLSFYTHINCLENWWKRWGLWVSAVQFLW